MEFHNDFYFNIFLGLLILSIFHQEQFGRYCTQEFKPHKKEKDELFLFNLARDPNETENLAESEPTIVQELKKIVKNLTKVEFFKIILKYFFINI